MTSRTYIKDANGKVTNAKPRKKPQWTEKAPTRDGYYWLRLVYQEQYRDPDLLVARVSCCPSVLHDKVLALADVNIFYPENVHVHDGYSHREWWPVRIKEPK